MCKIIWRLPTSLYITYWSPALTSLPTVKVLVSVIISYPIHDFVGDLLQKGRCTDRIWYLRGQFSDMTSGICWAALAQIDTLAFGYGA